MDPPAGSPAQPFTVTLLAREAEHLEIEEDRAVLGFRLPRLFAFAHPQLVKLVLVHTGTQGGIPSTPFFVFADFVEPQPFDDEFRPYLGSSQTSSNTWVPLSGNLLSSGVTLTLQTLSGDPFNKSLPRGLSLTIAVGPAATSYLRPFARPLHSLASRLGFASSTSSGSSSSESDLTLPPPPKALSVLSKARKGFK